MLDDIESRAPRDRVLRDRAHLEYTLRGGQIYVTYPPSYTGGFPVDYPPWYETDPPNDITRERVAIWLELKRGQA